MKNHTNSIPIALKICLRHHFEMAVITINALSSYSKVLAIFHKLFVAGKAMVINMSFIIDNIGTIITAAILLAIVIAIIYKLVKDKKQGKSSCSCGCNNCANASVCHPSNDNNK